MKDKTKKLIKELINTLMWCILFYSCITMFVFFFASSLIVWVLIVREFPYLADRVLFLLKTIKVYIILLVVSSVYFLVRSMIKKRCGK